MTKESIQTYSYRITQASRTELVVIQYDMAMEYIEDAVKAYEEKDSKEFCDQLRYAKRVINELSATLNHNYEISGQLFRLYLYMDRVLVSSIAKKEDTGLEQVISMLKTLRKSWAELSKTDTSGPLMRNTQQVYAGYTYSAAGSSNEYTSQSDDNRGFCV